MSLLQKLVSRGMFPIQEKLKGHSTLSAFRSMERSQWLAPGAMAELQLDNLRSFLIAIYETVPYYQGLFTRIGFNPREIKGLSCLQRLPLLDKSTIKANTESMTALNPCGLKRFNTGGSSGEPLIFYLGTERVSHDVAAKRRATRWWDVDIGDREIVVWGSPIELGSQDRIRLIRDKLFRTELLSAFEMSATNLDLFVSRITAVRPAMLFGYPSSLALIAQYALDTGRVLSDLGIKVVFVTSERLYDHQREIISRVFGCPVANGYGGRDAGFIAHECPEGRLHITAEDIVVEIADANGNVLPPGESGEIIVTHMRTRDFPFIRYRTGDVGVLGIEPCACGRGLPVLTSVEGRATDFVTAADGTVLHGLALIYILRDIPAVQEFRIVQETLERTCVQLVAPGRDTDMEEDIRRLFRSRLGQSVTIDIDYVTSIPREKSGKYRYVTSRVNLR